MPFDLHATTHTFIKTEDGGLQRVEADDPFDETQIALVRGHLHEEQRKFQRGDYDDPARIHGMDMPGLAALEAGYDRITVTYDDRPRGAELRYRTNDADLISAVHEWFDRQVVDHGDHARAG
jgi:hypothetical protein